MKHFVLFTFALLLTFCALNAQIIIPQSSVWKYLDDGSNQGTAWYASNFNDSSWSQGAAQLGYGDGDETTVLSYGSSSSNKHITYYFRKSFNVSNPSLKNGIKVELLRDDGAVVYLNGVELFRSNMPNGSINYQTHAASTVAGSAESSFYSYTFPSSLLNSGTNVIAVEVHQRSSSSSDMSFDLRMSFTDYSIVRKAPYLLFPDDSTKMLLLWQLKTSNSCTLKWGTDTTYSTGQTTTQEYANDHQHKFMITALNPQTRYFYQVIVDSINEIKSGSFVTGETANAQSLHFYAYGDTRSNPQAHNDVAAEVLNSISQDSLSRTFIVSSGDIVSNGDQESDWDSQLFDPAYVSLQKMLAELPYLASMGNHEGQGLLFEKYFPYPMYANNSKYYAFDYGPVHFIVIDQFESYNPGTTQYNWIVNDLSSTAKKWKIALLHMPAWSAQGGHSNNKNAQTILHPLFKKYGVQFVIAGHNHYYARASANKVQYITTGGGGAPLYTPNPNADSVVTVDKSYHFCKIDIDGDTMLFTAIRSDGSQIESFTYTADEILGIHSASPSEIPAKIYSDDKTIFVQLGEPGKARVSVYDCIGKCLISKDISTNRQTFRIDNAGVYFVRIEMDGKSYVKKLMVK